MNAREAKRKAYRILSALAYSEALNPSGLSEDMMSEATDKRDWERIREALLEISEALSEKYDPQPAAGGEQDKNEAR